MNGSADGVGARGTPGWDGLVVLVAGSVWGGVRLSEPHVAERLVRYAPVLYVDPPLSWRARGDPALAPALAEQPLRLVSPGLARLTPRVPPGKRYAGLRQISDVLTRRALRDTLRSLGRPHVRAVITVPERPIFGVCGEELRVHWAKDDYVAGAGLVGHPVGRRRRGERRMAREADTVVVASPALLRKWRNLGTARVVFMPPGCDAEGLGRTDRVAPAAEVRLPPPIAGYLGGLSPRVDLDLLAAVADRGHSLLLVGPRHRMSGGARLESLLARANVQWVGAQPFAQLPAYLHHIDVGLVPYADTAFNRASFPLKVLEYLAAGRSVVSTDLPSVRWLDTGLITIAGEEGAFVQAVERALAGRPSADVVATRRRFAGLHSWDRRVEGLVSALDLTGSRPPASIPTVRMRGQGTVSHLGEQGK